MPPFYDHLPAYHFPAFPASLSIGLNRPQSTAICWSNFCCAFSLSNNSRRERKIILKSNYFLSFSLSLSHSFSFSVCLFVIVNNVILIKLCTLYLILYYVSHQLIWNRHTSLMYKKRKICLSLFYLIPTCTKAVSVIS